MKKIGILFLLIIISITPVCHADFFLHSPMEGAKVENNRPEISLSLGGKNCDISTIKILVNDQDVTNKAVITPGFIIYKPDAPLPEGRNTVNIIFKSKKGKNLAKKWSFYISSKNRIDSVRHDAKNDLMVKEKLKVTLIGEPLARASFDIGRWKRNIPMKEVSPGIYEGFYEVSPTDNVSDAKITGKLRTKVGGVYEKTANTPVTINAQFFRVKILEPKNNAYVTQVFTLKGRTTPNTLVKISMGLAFNVGGDALSAPAKPGGGVDVDVDETGFFQLDMGFPIAVKGMKMAISCQAIDRKGKRSFIDTITVYLKTKKKESKPDSQKK
ncbi:MAG: hypothetical protein K8T10_07720 [Candidatus Eremiobacteraeota bacterium]|nr:hypothetical protein [Candidatus Eremiobacteraeota bacterium]